MKIAGFLIVVFGVIGFNKAMGFSEGSLIFGLIIGSVSYILLTDGK